jgi:hypothetical protein
MTSNVITHSRLWDLHASSMTVDLASSRMEKCRLVWKCCPVLSRHLYAGSDKRFSPHSARSQIHGEAWRLLLRAPEWIRSHQKITSGPTLIPNKSNASSMPRNRSFSKLVATKINRATTIAPTQPQTSAQRMITTFRLQSIR